MDHSVFIIKTEREEKGHATQKKYNKKEGKKERGYGKETITLI